MLLSLTTSLPLENKHVEIRQWDFPVSERKIAIADSNLPFRDLDIAPKTVGFCGWTTECSYLRSQYSCLSSQHCYFRSQFRADSWEKLLSATGILLSINGILLFPIAMLRSGIAMSRSTIGIWRESNESFDMPDGKYACQSEKYEKAK